jgi:ABC-type sugar transport system permease subunit
VKLFMTLITLTLVVSLTSSAECQQASTPQWRTLNTGRYSKKRDDIVFANALTGFYSTGKGKLYRTEDGGKNWHVIWSKQGTFIRSLPSTAIWAISARVLRTLRI